MRMQEFDLLRIKNDRICRVRYGGTHPSKFVPDPRIISGVCAPSSVCFYVRTMENGVRSSSEFGAITSLLHSYTPLFLF